MESSDLEPLPVPCIWNHHDCMVFIHNFKMISLGLWKENYFMSLASKA